MAVPTSTSLSPVSPVEEDRRIVELTGRYGIHSRVHPSPLQSRAVDALQLQIVDNLVEIVQLRGQLEEALHRIDFLVLGIRRWRTRAQSEAAARRREQRGNEARERDLVSALHQQIVACQEISDQLEQCYRRRWWHRLSRR